MLNRLLLLSLFGFVLLTAEYPARAESLTGFGLPEISGENFVTGEYVGSWYATNDSGTYIVSGYRVVMFDGVQLPEELAGRLMDLLAGAAWKEGYLLSHELLLNLLWPHLPDPVKLVLRGTSQAWLLLTFYRSVIQVASPLVALLDDYRKAWSEQRYQGTLPIAVNDAELSFRVFMQARFPEKITDPVAIDIDRVPGMSDLPTLVRPHNHLNPWTRLLTEMSAGDIYRLQLAGASDGSLELRFRDQSNGWREQVITVSLDSAYQPVPWLLEMVRNKVSRENIRLYASLLSQDVIELAGQMLACRRIDADRPGEGYCPGGRLLHGSGGLEYYSDNPVVPPQIWEKRNYEQGRVLPLTGCDFNGQALCWENYLIWGNGSVLYPWPVLTLYTRFASFKERNSWILLEHEPQVWYTGSYFQLRVPELVTRAMLATFSSVGQVMVNRLVTSLHHGWWGHGAVKKEPAALPESESAPDESQHARGYEVICHECGDRTCKYPLCMNGCGRFREETMVDLGCSHGGNKHLLCTDCFEGIIRASAVKPCSGCDQFHFSMINRDYYQIDPEEAQRDTPSAPMCPTCRARFDSRLGNVGRFLFEECGALTKHLKWLFSDGLGVDAPASSVVADEK